MGDHKTLINSPKMTKFSPMNFMKVKTLMAFLVLFFGIFGVNGYAQVDSSSTFPEFDSQLLRLKVPEAFQKSSLKLEVFADSSWQLYRGNAPLDFISALELLGQSHVIDEYNDHLHKEAEFLKEYRSRRVFSIVSSVAGATYLTIAWSKGWVYQIPGYVAIAIAGVRYMESRKIEVKALREQYYLQTLIKPSSIQKLVDNYNFQLYQYLSTAGIQFSDQ